MLRIFFISIIFHSFIFCQTGIITSKGFDGIGFWTTLNQPFSESDKLSYDFQLDFYSALGLEFSIGSLRKESSNSINRIGLGYHFKLTDFGFVSKPFGFMIKYSLNTLTNYNFSSDDILFKDFKLTFYRTGKLNPFFEIISENYQSVNHSNKFYVRIGGLGRVKRFLTLSCSLKIPVDERIDINNGFIEASVGLDFNWINRLLF